ncbi:MAG TPA: hypothetical protein VLT86_03610 [Vicinamibacterales bacterium]|nr:hypothetical protein [Vicinamibacterales bacterium]
MLLAAGGLLLAVAAFLRVAAATRKYQALSQSHWELRFEFARLRARVAKLDGGGAGDAGPDATAPPSES